MSIINTYNFFLSSEKRTKGTTDNFQTSLFNSIGLESPNNWFTVRVGSVEIPYVFKLINSTNNIINFTLIRGSTYNSTITLTPGNYNILTLITEFKSQLSAKIQTLTGWDPTVYFNFTYDRTSGFVTFALIGNDSNSTSITIQDNSSVFLKCVGFSAPFTFGYTSPSARTVVVSTQNVNVSQNTAVYVRSESFKQTSNIENIVTDNEPSDILSKIQVTSQPQTYIYWTNPYDLEVKITNRTIDVINLYVGSSTAYQIDLGNLDWSCRLTVHEYGTPQQDYAINMTRSPTDEGLQNLLDEREKALTKLKKIRSKLSLPMINEAEANAER